MASTIITRTISGNPETAILMSNSSWARPVSLPTGWSKIRVGLRYHFAPFTAQPGTSTVFALGFGSGTTNIIGDYSTTNFIGAYFNGSWTVNAGTYLNFVIWPATRVLTALTIGGSSIFGNNLSFLACNALATADRSLLFVDITKGSPNYTVNVFIITGGGAPPDYSSAQFLTYVETASPVVANYSFGTARTIAFDESNGALNSVQCWWNSSSGGLPEICDLAVVVLS